MRWGLCLSAAVLAGVCATWAYRVNYATQEAAIRVAELEARIAAEREALSVLHAEWAYLNRPDRLAALVKGPGAALGLAPLTPEQFGEAAMAPFPPEPETVAGDAPPAAGAPAPGAGATPAGVPSPGAAAPPPSAAAAPARDQAEAGPVEGTQGTVTGPRARIAAAGARP